MSEENEKTIEDINLQDDNDELLQFVTFFIGEEFYGVDIHKVKEVIKMTQITPVPRSVEYVVGVINLRGQVIPVIDLRLRFSLKTKEYDKHTRIIVAEVNGKNMGMIVDKMNKVERIAESKMKKEKNVLSSIDSDFIERIGKIGDEIMIVIDIELLFGKV